MLVYDVIVHERGVKWEYDTCSTLGSANRLKEMLDLSGADFQAVIEPRPVSTDRHDSRFWALPWLVTKDTGEWRANLWHGSSALDRSTVWHEEDGDTWVTCWAPTQAHAEAEATFLERKKRSSASQDSEEVAG